jgi:hypothetical protein
MDHAAGLSVECYAGYRSAERPLRFLLGDRAVEVSTVLDCWLGPDHRYFKVRGDDGDVYILRHDTNDDRWDLTMYERKHGGETRRR